MSQEKVQKRRNPILTSGQAMEWVRMKRCAGEWQSSCCFMWKRFRKSQICFILSEKTISKGHNSGIRSPYPSQIWLGSSAAPPLGARSSSSKQTFPSRTFPGISQWEQLPLNQMILCFFTVLLHLFPVFSYVSLTVIDQFLQSHCV